MNRMSRFVRVVTMAVLTAAAGLLAYSQGGFAARFLLCFLGGTLAYAVSVLLFSLLQVRLERRLFRTVLTPDEVLTVELSIRMVSLLPTIWLTVTERWVREQDGEIFGFRQLLFPWFRGRIPVRYGAEALPRGVYRLLETELATGDVLGLAVKRRILRAGSEDRFTVLPKPQPLSAGSLPQGEGAEELPVAAMPFWSLVHGMGSTVREYAQGDPLHRIHWKSTARRGELMTRDPEPQEELKLWVVLDGSMGAYTAGRAGSLRFEKAVEWTAGILQTVSEQGVSSGFQTNAGKGLRVFPLGRNEQVRAFRILAELLPGGDTPLGTMLLEEVDPGVPAGYTLVCITPSLSENVAEAILLLRERRRPVLLLHVQERPSLSERERRRRLEQAGCSVQTVTEPFRERGVRPYAGITGA